EAVAHLVLDAIAPSDLASAVACDRPRLAARLDDGLRRPDGRCRRRIDDLVMCKIHIALDGHDRVTDALARERRERDDVAAGTGLPARIRGIAARLAADAIARRRSSVEREAPKILVAATVVGASLRASAALADVVDRAI